MLDMPGPEVRTAPIRDSIELVEGTTVRFVEGDTATPAEVGLDVYLGRRTGRRRPPDDGRIETTVQRVEDGVVHATVESGGELGARKGVNVPGVELGLPVITENDKRELDVAAEMKPDFVAASFVRDGENIYEIEEALEDRGVDIPIIAKIERAGAVENLDSIIDAADAVMVARGDLGVECPLEDVPIIQKRIIRKCHLAGVPVITATEMLDSMIHERRPTRAEASDVANAVLDGTDAVMLSGRRPSATTPSASSRRWTASSATSNPVRSTPSPGNSACRTPTTPGPTRSPVRPGFSPATSAPRRSSRPPSPGTRR